MSPNKDRYSSRKRKRKKVKKPTTCIRKRNESIREKGLAALGGRARCNRAKKLAATGRRLLGKRGRVHWRRRRECSVRCSWLSVLAWVNVSRLSNWRVIGTRGYSALPPAPIGAHGLRQRGKCKDTYFWYIKHFLCIILFR